MKEKEWKVIPYAPYYGLQKNYFSKNARLEFIQCVTTIPRGSTTEDELRLEAQSILLG